MKQSFLRLFCFSFFLALLSREAVAQVGLHDPTKPALPDVGISGFEITEPDKNQRYTVQAIIVDAHRRFAIVNDQKVGVGSKIGNARVIAIDRNSIMLLDGGQKIKLFMFDPTIWK